MTLRVLELIGLLQAPVMWWAFRRYFKRDMTGEMIASAIVGVVWEIATEPLWDYHFSITYYKDAPLAELTGWMVMFPLVILLSEKLYRTVLKKEKLLPHDKRIFLFDIISAQVICLPLEAAGAKLGVWTYRLDILGWHWGAIPFFDLPLEVPFGYSLLMLIAPTFIRYWQKDFE